MSTKEYLLIVENDPSCARALVHLFQTRGYTATVSLSGQDALEVLQCEPPDLLLLSIPLADMDGFDMLRHVRNFSNVPIVMLGSETYDSRKVRALEAGADDFITRPFYEEELVARIAALLRRIQWTPLHETTLKVDQLRVDISHRRATLRGKMLHLTPIEFSILCTLMQNAGQIVTHEELMENVWGDSYQSNCSVLRVNISRLRQKIEEQPERPRYILTVPRRGYRMPA